MKPKSCPVCENRLGIAYQQRPPMDPCYIVVCRNLVLGSCKAYGVVGFGDTEQQAIEDFHRKTQPIIDKLFDKVCAKT